MSSTVAIISKRAKKIRRPGETWQSAIKRSSKMGKTSLSPSKKRAKRKTAPRKKVKYHQTGTSNKIYDEKVKAKKPGKRKSHTGRTYYENRKNRSDMPGKMTGAPSAYNEMILGRMRSNNLALAEAERVLKGMQDRYKAMPRGIEKSRYKTAVDRQKKYMATIKGDLRMLKALIR